MSVIHATCVAIDRAGVLLRGDPGAGKSDLALRLIDEGAVLVADDYCQIGVENGVLIAETPPQIAGKIEVRGYGIVTMPFLSRTAVRLVVDLTASATIPRLPESTTAKLMDVTVAQAFIDPVSASASARVRTILHDLAGVAGKEKSA
jgi:HPr kinase/phosphorylase